MEQATAALIASIISLIGLAVTAIKGAIELGAIKTKVDTMWAFQMRRAMSEVVERGIGTINSPIVFTEQAYLAMEPIKAELLAFWTVVVQPISDPDALLLIEATFGARLLHMVCVPCALSHGACLILALSIAKQSGDIVIA